MAKNRFIQQFWKEKKTVGAVLPSSRFLAEKMLENIDFKETKVIVEIGPGTGVFTRKIIERMSDDALLFVFELNAHFVEMLKSDISDKRVVFIHDSAEKIEEYLNRYNVHGAEVVVSSLPFSNIPEEIRFGLAKSIADSIIETGRFIQFQYSTQCKEMFKSIFSSVEISFTPLNIPPAFVYTCLK